MKRLNVFALTGMLCVSLFLGGCEAKKNETLTEQQSDTASSFDESSIPQQKQAETKDKLLPFSILPARYMPEEVRNAEELALEKAANTVRWTVGGDFRTIASFPLNESRLFGSSSHDPESLDSYSPAFIHSDGTMTTIDMPARERSRYLEPQDGSSNGQWIVFRSGAITDDVSVDNWELSVVREDGTKGRRVLSAKELTGSDTPARLPGEHIPTLSNRSIYFQAAVQGESQWQSATVVIPIERGSTGSVDYKKLENTRAVAATADGAILISADGMTLEQYNEQTGQRREILSMSPQNEQWKFAGIWASDKYFAVSVENFLSDQGSYIAIIDLTDSQSLPQWIWTPSKSVSVSINDSWITWGSGWSALTPEMYVMSLRGNNKIWMLGKAPGYSHPVLSRQGNVLIVPSLNEDNIARYSVVDLGEW